MPSDAKSKTATSRREKIVNAALSLAAEQPWQDVTLSAIAAKARVSLADMHDDFADKTDILSVYGRMLDRRVLARWSGEEDSTPRDKLFDLLMERYECLNDDRAALTSILKSFRLDPKQAVIGLPHLCRSMAWMLEAAGVSTSGLQGAARVSGLTAIYLHGLKTWMNDEGADLAKTMAALDKDLGRAEYWAVRFGV